MKKLLSPKQVARAIGVSESSVKRWCDQKLIPTERTAGGHRRLPLDAVVEFIRDGGYELRDPQILGLPATSARVTGTATIERAKNRFRRALVAGDDDAARQIVLDLYLAKQAVSVICDQVVAAAFEEIGDFWECGDVEVYEERRACEISSRLVHELRELVPPPPADAPVAIGGTLDGDPYTLAVSMAELVLRDVGWNASSLGHMLPFATLHAAMQALRPKLIWLSVSVVRCEERFVEEMNRLFETAESLGVALAIGGRSLSAELRRQLRYTAFCDTFQHLEDYSRSIFPDNITTSKPPNAEADDADE